MVTYEYASATYGAALEGLPVPDEEALNAVAADGWEPILMTSVHNGFAVMILFRRELGHVAPRRPATKSRGARSATAKAGNRAGTSKRAAPKKAASARSTAKSTTKKSTAKKAAASRKASRGR